MLGSTQQISPAHVRWKVEEEGTVTVELQLQTEKHIFHFAQKKDIHRTSQNRKHRILPTTPSPHPHLLHPNNRLIQRRLVPGQRPLIAPLRLHGMNPWHRRNTPVVEPHPTFPADGLVRVVGFVAAAVGLVVLWLVEAVEGEGVVVVVAAAAGGVREVVPE